MMSDADHPWFRPLWTRILVTCICVVWAGLEWWGGQQLWAMVATGMTAYAVWMFFIRGRTAESGEEGKE